MHPDLTGQPPAFCDAPISQFRFLDEGGRRGIPVHHADNAAPAGTLSSAGCVEENACLLRCGQDGLPAGAGDALPVRLEVNDRGQEGVSSLILPERKAAR